MTGSDRDVAATRNRVTFEKPHGTSRKTILTAIIVSCGAADEPTEQTWQAVLAVD